MHDASPAPRLLPLGDAAWTVEFGDRIATSLHARVMGLSDQLAERRAHGDIPGRVTDIVPTFRSLTVYFDPLDTQADALGEFLLALACAAPLVSRQGRHWRLPVCFEPGFAPDLPRVAEASGLTAEAVITLLISVPYTVYMLGFQPGFAYMGGVPEALQLPRLPEPRSRVPAQSLAIAGAMCAVYPWESPGGWNLLGRTPVRLFDPQQQTQPAMLAAGDTVQWFAIDRAQHDDLARQVAQGRSRALFLHEGL